MSEIHEKITNLLELARNNPSEEEAATAMAMARRLMLKYNIEERDLRGHTPDVEYSGGGSFDRDYYRLVAQGITRLLPIRYVYWNGNKAPFKWVGTNVNAQIADQMFQFWVDQIEILYKKYLPPGMSKPERAQYRTDFKRNCALGIINRAVEIKRQQAIEDAQGTALVVIEDQLLAEINEFMNNEGVKKSKSRGMTIRRHTQGAAHGRQASHEVRLTRVVR